LQNKHEQRKAKKADPSGKQARKQATVWAAAGITASAYTARAC